MAMTWSSRSARNGRRHDDASATGHGGLFAEDVWKPNERWLVRGGLRGEYVSGANWLGVSPRARSSTS